MAILYTFLLTVSLFYCFSKLGYGKLKKTTVPLTEKTFITIGNPIAVEVRFLRIFVFSHLCCR